MSRYRKGMVRMGKPQRVRLVMRRSGILHTQGLRVALPALRHRRRITRAAFRAACIGSAGVKITIAENLGVTRDTVCKYLVRKPDMQKYVHAADVAMIDVAENTIHHAIAQKKDLLLATQNARWFLARRATVYRDTSNVNLSGGDKPIQVEQQISIADLKLPLSVKRMLIAAIDKREAELSKKKES